MSSKAREQREELIQYLGAMALFDDLPLVAQDSGDIQNEYDRALGANTVTAGGKQGVMALFQSVIAPGDKADDFGRVFKFRHRVTVMEDVLMNRDATVGTGVTREEWIERIVRNVTAIFQPSVAGSPLVVEPDGIQDGAVGIDDADGNTRALPARHVVFACTGGLGAPDMSVISKPVISHTAPAHTIAITCATAGAAIFYTTDGSKPRPGKTLYTGTFTAAVGTVVKARAYLIGMLQPGSADRDSIAELTVPA